jgi:purine-binding chemotaxis protein CheW
VGVAPVRQGSQRRSSAARASAVASSLHRHASIAVPSTTAATPLASSSREESFLVCRMATCLCALPLDHVVETLRPLPIEMLAGAPPFVLGVSVVRGEPLPVVDLAQLLDGVAAPIARLVTLATGRGRVALAVGDVLGLRTLGAEQRRELPDLLREGCAGVAALGALDSELLLVLRGARLVPDSVWSAVAEERASP